MKRLLTIVLVAALLTACGGGNDPVTTPTTVPSMVPSVEGKLYTELGVAVEEWYYTGGVERNPWDVELYNGQLFVGSGDYDTNAGPVAMFHYDFAKKTWEVDTFLNDEQIGRFYVIDGKLYAPGFDPKSSWDMGTYYRHNGTEWETLLSLPNAAHNFDMIKFDGKLFAALGAKSGNWPILTTTDEETWTPVPMYRGDTLVDVEGYTYVRVYEFLTLNGELYANFSLSGSDSGKPAYFEIYRYDGDKFVLHSEMTRSIGYNLSTYTRLHQQAEFKGHSYFSTGFFYRSADMITAEKLTLAGDPEVGDLRVIGDKLYALCSEAVTAADGSVSFKNSLRVTTDGKTFTEVFSFDYPVRALSFTYGDGTVFLGMGFGTKARKDESLHDKNGMILAINRVL